MAKCKFCGAEVTIGERCTYCGSKAEGWYYSGEEKKQEPKAYYVGTVVKRTPTGLLDIEWWNGRKERFKSNGYEYHRSSGYGRTSFYLEPYTEERGRQVIQENKRKCMVGWLKEFDYTKLSYEEAEQVYTLVVGLKNS